MKHLLFAAFLFASTALADTPAQIAADYRKQAAQAVERLNQSLEKAATPLITKLIAGGDTKGAEKLTKEMRAKIAGESVPAPQASAVQLFTLYDEARAKALAPVQKSGIARVDSMLKTAGGPKLETLTELGKVREEIESGGITQDASALKSFLKKNKIPKVWGYYSNIKYEVRLGTLELNDDGTMLINAASPVTGTWTATSDPTVLAFDLKNAAAIPEKTEMKINGTEAVLKRVSGMRYLKAE